MQTRKGDPSMPAKRTPPTVKSASVLRFYELTAQGVPAKAAARRIGEPLSSIYRWCRNHKKIVKLINAHQEGALTINEAVATIAHQHNDRYAIHEALFKILAWMRWPAALGDHPAVVTSCVTSYLWQNSGAETADQLDGPMRDFLLKSLRLHELAHICTADFRERPEFENIDGRDPATMYYMLADTVWFLTTYEHTTTDPRRRASLKKAAYLFECDAFGAGTPSVSAFSARWRSYGASAPFWFVMREATDFDLGNLSPRSRTFAADVDRLLHRHSDVISFLRKCKWVTALLRDRADARAWGHLDLPIFPESLEPESFDLRPMPAAVEVALADY